jgi:predicted RNase H-like nuclease (RuvC/YqgF family)
MGQKMVEMREKFAKNQNDYEKNIRLINSHVDDLKTQNMDLQATISQLQDRKGNNLQAERKSLEESLRLKTNNINALKLLVNEKDQRI